MKRKLILIFCILFLYVSAHAGIVDKLKAVIARKNVAAGLDVSHVLFWLTFEAGDDTGDYDIDGDPDCSEGDTSGAYSNAVLNSGSVLSGTYALEIPTSSDYMVFVISDDIADQGEGRIGFWLRKYTNYSVGDNDSFVSLSADASNYLSIRFKNNGNVGLNWRQGGSSRVILTTSTDDYTFNTDYFIEVAWKPAADDIVMYVNNAKVLEDLTTDMVGEIAWTGLFLGEDPATASGTDDYYIDNVIIGNSYSTSLYGLRNYTTHQGSGAGALCQ